MGKQISYMTLIGVHSTMHLNIIIAVYSSTREVLSSRHMLEVSIHTCVLKSDPHEELYPHRTD